MNLTIVKRIVAALAVLGLTVAPIVANAASDWGPVRTTYTVPGPGATHVQFNSFTNNPEYGDERIFFDGKDAANTKTGGFQDPVDVTHSQELLLRVVVHNNANQTLNDAAHNFAGVAKGTSVKITLPTGQARSLRGQAAISATNATPATVFDSLDFTTLSPSSFSLSYESGSAVMYNRTHPNGMPLSDNVVKGGTLVGDDQADGIVPGCFEHQILVTIKVKVNVPSISLKKQVTTPGSTNWQSQLTGVKPGDTVSWLLTYQDTSNVTLNDVTLRDVMPAHLTLVPGSITWFDPNHPSGKVLQDTALGSGGVDLGTLGPNGGGSIRFRTTVNSDFNVNDCNLETLTNTGYARAKNLNEIAATASVVTATGQTCKVTPPPVTPPTVTPPTTPTPLPQTGAEGAAAGVMGTGALGYSLRAWLRSKRSLLDALKR